MDEPESKTEKPEKQRRLDPELLKKGLRCDLDQYEILKRCSEKGDEGIKEWNAWRGEKPKEEIWLQGANLSNAYLKRAYLEGVHLEGATLWYAKLQRALLPDTHLEAADLRWSHLEGAILANAHLEGARLGEAHLERADLGSAHLKGADLRNAHLEGAEFRGASLKSALFIGAIVDGNTNMWKVKVDQFRISTAKDWLFTDFSGVPLQSVIIDPATKQLIEYNIRRKYWYKWINQKDWGGIFPPEYEGNKRTVFSRIIHYSVHLFFWISDYGLRTFRIIATFFTLALFFAAIYSNLAYWWHPGIVSHLTVEPHLPIWHYFLLLLLRPIYFSIVTMTTLGFGDMYANAQSIWGHILLSLQVILGYVLLGALVTRFAVLFTAGGPAGRFADDKKKKE